CVFKIRSCTADVIYGAAGVCRVEAEGDVGQGRGTAVVVVDAPAGGCRIGAEGDVGQVGARVRAVENGAAGGCRVGDEGDVVECQDRKPIVNPPAGGASGIADKSNITNNSVRVAGVLDATTTISCRVTDEGDLAEGNCRAIVIKDPAPLST